MKCMIYECKEHGRIEKYGILVKRKGKIFPAKCPQCNVIAIVKFIYVCKIHGELTDDKLKPIKDKNPICRLCHRIGANNRRNNNRDEFNGRMAIDRINNPEKWNKEYKRQYKKLRENHGTDLSLMKVCQERGITVEKYYQLLDEQDNKCAICLQEETCKDSKNDRIRRLSIDHCHITKKARGLLCQGCNVAIGRFKDDINLMERAIEYVKKHYHTE